MEGLQHSYKPISRILGYRVAAKAKGEVELAEAGGWGRDRKAPGMKGKELRREEGTRRYEKKERVLPQSMHSHLHPTHKVTWESEFSITGAQGLFGGSQLPSVLKPQAKPQVSPWAPSP